MTTRPFRPSNGTHGMLFCEAFCHRCKRDAEFQADPENNADKACPIYTATLIFDATDPRYPTEWVIDIDGHPGGFGGKDARCTAFEPMETAP